MTTQDFRIVKSMSIHGGSFAKTIAIAAKLADENNYNKLKQAFPELWEEYKKDEFINEDGDIYWGDVCND